MTWPLWLAIFLLGAYPLSHGVLRFLKMNHIVPTNYRQERIPVSTGLLFAVLTVFFLVCIRLGIEFGDSATSAHLSTYQSSLAVFSVLVIVVFFVGWLDDSVGERSIKGFKGHLKQWHKERHISTGLLKAGVIACLSLWAVWEVQIGSFESLQPSMAGVMSGMARLFQLFVSITQWLLITLSANVLNLFDLRPGRALKVSSLVIVFIVIIGVPSLYWPYLTPVAIGVILLFPSDVRAQSTLGDAGANLIGFVLGFCLVIASPFWLQLAFLCVFMWIHWLAERISLSQYIESRSVLRKLD